MTRPIRDLDVPLSTLREQMADLIARQSKAVSEDVAVGRLRWLLAHPEPASDPDATPAFPTPTAKEAS
ncbi:hypothetical protein ACFVT5_40875 [Streptomyces sp. NPDC058001]|uniref:hypothetical protein n=1 Tax=Streptomyces sp. NPDC058001 TaxID=3346300 RepID=UPI0036E34346